MNIHLVSPLLVITATVMFNQPAVAQRLHGTRLRGVSGADRGLQGCHPLAACAEEFCLDPQRFGVWGSSAGGHLVAMVGTSDDVKAFDVNRNPDPSSRVQTVCDYFEPTDFTVFVTMLG